MWSNDQLELKCRLLCAGHIVLNVHETVKSQDKNIFYSGKCMYNGC